MFVESFNTVYLENIIVDNSSSTEKSSVIYAEEGFITIIGTEYCSFTNLVHYIFNNLI